MQIIIPMTGIGKRFLDAGYTDPKPLIKVDGQPIIKYVIDLFPGENNITFICNSKHLEETNMRNVLNELAPQGKIVSIPPHKLGPVYAVTQISDMISDDDEVIVNYCDFSKYWNYQDFLTHTRKRNAEGAISAYKGFHPHMLGTTNYAFIRDHQQWMIEIQEKKPFTENRMNEYASDGTYYFRNGRLVKKYFNELIEKKIDINGEYYVSMVFNLLVNDGLKVSIYEIQHMLQWGTPRDLEEYQNWSNYFSAITLPHPNIDPQDKSINLIPLAGRGSRFLQEGYTQPKPLIPINGKPMIVQAANYLPKSKYHTFVCLGEHLDNFPLEEEIKLAFPNALIIRVDQVTEGQACTCQLGLNDADLDAPLLIGACDNGMLWDSDQYYELISDPSVDAIVWSFRHHPSSERNPHMYGWLEVDEQNNVKRVSVKKQISDDPYNDFAIVGTFYFRKVKFYLEGYHAMIKKNIRVNNEFYVDSLINELIEQGRSVKNFEVQHYVGWGTPNDLRTYEYWQSFFHKCSWHPYTLEKDITINPSVISELNQKYHEFKQAHQ